MRLCSPISKWALPDPILKLPVKFGREAGRTSPLPHQFRGIGGFDRWTLRQIWRFSLYYSLLAGKWGGEWFAGDSIHRHPVLLSPILELFRLAIPSHFQRLESCFSFAKECEHQQLNDLLAGAKSQRMSRAEESGFSIEQMKRLLAAELSSSCMGIACH